VLFSLSFESPNYCIALYNGINSYLETINDIFNPMEKVERQIAVLNTKLSAVYDIVSKPTPTAKDSNHECCCSGTNQSSNTVIS
jgi:hypothetical protein